MGVDKLHLLQALSYAAMVSEWDRDQIVGQRAKFRNCADGEAEEEIEEFLNEDILALNAHQRVLLVAEGYGIRYSQQQNGCLRNMRSI